MIGEAASLEEPAPDYGMSDMEVANTFGLTPEELAEIDAILAGEEDYVSPSLGAESVIRFASDGHTSPGANMNSDSAFHIDFGLTPKEESNPDDADRDAYGTLYGELVPSLIGKHKLIEGQVIN